ncbi:YaaR family protein [Desulfoscipio sp. XC116]|uniref:YaaR family protein n=1 Tax=Desulfoscipio sp. XC116 TaxID=3144975 RepID=UPI00325B96E9
MKISVLDKNISKGFRTSVVKVNKSKEFQDSLDMAKRDQQHQEINKMIKKIKASGNKLKNTRSIVDVRIYKQHIADYLNHVLNYCYSISHSRGYQGLLSRVEIINQKLEELTQEILNEQKQNIVIAGKIDEITGLLIDFHT